MKKNDRDNNHIKHLSGTRLFRGLSDEQCAAVFQEVKIKQLTLPPGDTIVRQGDVQNDFYYVCAGIVRGEKFHIEGGIHLVDNYEADDFIGLDTVCSTTRLAPWTLTAGEESPVLLKISADDLLTWAWSSVNRARL